MNQEQPTTSSNEAAMANDNPNLLQFDKSNGEAATYPNNGTFVFGKMIQGLASIYLPVIERLTFDEANAFTERMMRRDNNFALDILRNRMTVEDLADEKAYLADETERYVQDRFDITQGFSNKLIQLALESAFALAKRSIGLL